MKTLASLSGFFLVTILTLTFLCLALEDPLYVKYRQMRRQMDGMAQQMNAAMHHRCAQLLDQAEICRQRARNMRADADRLSNETYRAAGLVADVRRLYTLSRTERRRADSLLREAQGLMEEVWRAEPAKP